MTPFDAVQTEALGKVFGSVVALRKVGVTLAPGVTFLLGKNGAGKSTLLHLLAGLTSPTIGKIFYGGKSSKELGITLRASIGLAPEQPLAYGELTGLENIHMFARLYRLKNPAAAAREAVRSFGLEQVASRLARGYSQGERRRLGLARAFLHDPCLLLLDEPTSGLDGAGAQSLARTVEARAEQGTIVVIATHDPWFGYSLGGRALTLESGKVVSDAPAPKELSAWQNMLKE